MRHNAKSADVHRRPDSIGCTEGLAAILPRRKFVIRSHPPWTIPLDMGGEKIADHGDIVAHLPIKHPDTDEIGPLLKSVQRTVRRLGAPGSEDLESDPGLADRVTNLASFPGLLTTSITWFTVIIQKSGSKPAVTQALTVSSL